MNVKTFLFRPTSLLTQYRNYQKGKGIKWFDGVKYGLVTYYPRHPDHQDPPITPTKLLMVQRVKPYKGNPYWHKKILNELNLTEKESEIAVVKNTPKVCAKLWEIKHLIKVTPINLPNNLPEDDSKATILHENGDFMITLPIDSERDRVTQEYINNPKKLDRATIENELRMRWLNPYDL